MRLWRQAEPARAYSRDNDGVSGPITGHRSDCRELRDVGGGHRDPAPDLCLAAGGFEAHDCRD
jgi:hypothetical protein